MFLICVDLSSGNALDYDLNNFLLILYPFNSSITYIFYFYKRFGIFIVVFLSNFLGLQDVLKLSFCTNFFEDKTRKLP